MTRWLLSKRLTVAKTKQQVFSRLMTCSQKCNAPVKQ